MNCSVCNIRGSVGYCAECKTLLCEECGIVCERCGKMACSKHVYVTSSGRQICTVCQAERREKRKQQTGETAAAPSRQPVQPTSFEALEGEEPLAPTAATGAELPVSAEALTMSGRAPIPPWKLSLYSSLGSLVSVTVILIIPAFWSMLLGANTSGLLPFLVILVPLLPAFLSILWAIGGLFTSPYIEDRAKCLIGLGISVVAIVLGSIAAARAPAYIESMQPDILKGTRTEDMTPEQLEQWRKEQLRRFSQ